MKRLILLPALLLYVSLFSQNSSVMEFVNKNMGKKVGTGICHDFVVQAENTKYKNWNENYYLNADSMAAHWIPIDSAREGDVILFDHVVMSDSTELDHIGIFSGKWNDIVGYVSQNIGSHKDKEKNVVYKGQVMSVFKNSKVVYKELDMSKYVSGEIYTFRF